MRQRFLLLITTLFVINVHAPASADEPIILEPTRIETDAEGSQINFYIDGQLMAVLKDDGFHVREGINYGGTLTDAGSAWVDTYVAGGTSESAIEGGDDEE